MGMNLMIRRSTSADLERYRRQGVDEATLLGDFDPGQLSGRGFGGSVVQLFGRMMGGPGGASGGFSGGQGVGGDVAEPTRPVPVCDLHKSWQIFHFAFTGTAWEGDMPAATLLAGDEVGDDLGYGPARVITVAETAAFARFLAGLDVEAVMERLDLPKMRKLDIYCVADEPNADDEADMMELVDDIEHYFPELQAYVADAARRGEGLLIWMS